MEQIAENVLRVLSAVNIRGNEVQIIGHLDRKLYLAVNKVLDRIGGSWNKKAQAHIFDADPTDRLNAVIESGVLDPKIRTGYFPTPAVIVDKMIELADIRPGQMILEPSAGQGHIADMFGPLIKGNSNSMVVICETLPENIHILEEKGYAPLGDFWNYVKFAEEGDIKFDRIVMNPPFERQADIDHVTAAYGLLAPGGILVTIMSAGVTFRANTKTVEFRENIMEPHSTYLKHLPSGAFSESGTLVNTVILRLEK